MSAAIHHGDCLEILRGMADASVDAVVTDPPYGLSFMGKKWDYDVPSADIWRECLRVLKPGGHLLAFAGTRTQHRMAVNIEDAGFEIRDMIAWVYGSGFPKSHNLQNAWQGWGTALKPALEPITLARRPIVGTVAENVLAHRTGALNIDACRVGVRQTNESGWSKTGSKASQNRCMSGANYARRPKDEAGAGRWPANLIYSGCKEVLDLFPYVKSRGNVRTSVGKSTKGFIRGQTPSGSEYTRNDSGSAARFFYCAKASKADRDEGCERLIARANAEWSQNLDGNDARGSQPRRNHHPTVKPTVLMRYLCRLVTPPSGMVLDPFMGSGSTGKAAILEGFQFIGIEREAEYVEIAKARIANADTKPSA